MIYLITAIICGSSISLIFAFAGKKKMDMMKVTLMNYLVAGGVSAAETFLKIGQGVTEKPFEGSFTFQLALITGVLYLLSFVVAQKSVLKNGPGATAVFNRLSMVFPVVFALVFWHESAGPLRFAGIALAIISLAVYGGGEGLKMNAALLAVWVCGGGAELCNAFFAKLCPAADKPFFMAAVFGVGALISAAVLIKRKSWGMSGQEAASGALLGLVNLGSAGFTVISLQKLPASIVFPSLAVSAILLSSIGGRVFFAETFSRRQKFALGLTLAALVILNV